MSAYTDLITSEHADKPKFVATVAASTAPFIDAQALAASMPAAFDLDNAIGMQLDVVGQWVGIGRDINTPLTSVFFSWDTTGLGWDQGYWQRPNDPTEGVTALGDDAYRLLLRAVIALNHWDGRIVTAKAAVEPLFPNNGIYIQDNQDMTITFVIGGPILDVVSAALLIGNYLALKPATVGIDYVFTSAPPLPVFGWDAEIPGLAGWDEGAWGQPLPAVVSALIATEGGDILTTEDGVVIEI